MRIFIIMMLFLGGAHVVWAKALVVSTHPIYLIAQDVTSGIEQPTLLLTAQQTGHDVQLTPKSRQTLQDAELVIWLGKQHEAPLQRILQNQKKAVSLLDSSILQTLPLRDVKGQAIDNTLDTHVWLEPNNAVRIAFFIAALRAQQHPEHKVQYWHNAQQFSQKMYDAARLTISPNRDRDYWAYHDAYQYLERILQLKFAGALSADHELSPTIAQIKYLSEHRPQQKMCLLAEYHTDQTVIKHLSPVKTVAVDEAMSDQNDFVTAWLKLANSIQQCFR